MTIVPVYASLLACLFVLLSVNAIRTRRRLGIALGDADNTVMLRAVRVHANFAEYVPFALIMIFLVESASVDPLLVHGLGATLVIARVSHAFGVSREPERFVFRVFGMALTFTVLLSSAVTLLIVAFSR